MPATGTLGTTDSVAASVMNPAPVTPRRALGAQHRDEAEQDLLFPAQVHAGRLGDEQRGERHVDVGAVEVERIAGGHDRADHALLAAGAFQLGHQAGQRGLGRGGAQHEQQLRLQIGEQRAGSRSRAAGQPCPAPPARRRAKWRRRS